jgi:hypothetical protein
MDRQFSRAVAIFLMLPSLNWPIPAAAKGLEAFKSATLARDVNGFRLGMSLAEVQALAHPTSLGGGEYEAAKDGVSYSFSVTPKGRVFFIRSEQRLGRFTIDQKFISTLKTRLAAKYGEPRNGSGDVFFWGLIEPVTDAYGVSTRFETMSASARVGSNGDEHTLEITLYDRRILWADEADLNRHPRQTAEGRIQF